MSVFETWGLFGGMWHEFTDSPMWSSTTYPTRRGIRLKNLLYKRRVSTPQRRAKGADISPRSPGP